MLLGTDDFRLSHCSGINRRARNLLSLAVVLAHLGESRQRGGGGGGGGEIAPGEPKLRRGFREPGIRTLLGTPDFRFGHCPGTNPAQVSQHDEREDEEGQEKKRPKMLATLT